MHFFLVTVRLWYFMMQDVFGDEAFTRGMCLLEGGVYFDLILKWYSAYLRLGADKKKYGKAVDAYCDW